MASPGRIFVISAPSGGGKDTLIKHAMAHMPGLKYSVSVTTRTPRPGEVDGDHYHFIDHTEFEQKRDADAFLEWAEVHGNFYGTLKSEVEDTILELDVQGMRQVRAAGLDATTVFIRPPSLEILEERLRGRGSDSPEVIALRLKNAKEEMAAENEYDHVIVNDDIDDAKAAFLAVLQA